MRPEWESTRAVADSDCYAAPIATLRETVVDCAALKLTFDRSQVRADNISRFISRTASSNPVNSARATIA